jgi:hypothetical protein
MWFHLFFPLQVRDLIRGLKFLWFVVGVLSEFYSESLCLPTSSASQRTSSKLVQNKLNFCTQFNEMFSGIQLRQDVKVS